MVREALSTESALVMLMCRPALGLNPPLDYTQTLKDCLLSVSLFMESFLAAFCLCKDTLRNHLLKIAPGGMSEVTTMMCGSCANENAFKAAFIWYMVSQMIDITSFVAFYIVMLRP